MTANKFASNHVTIVNQPEEEVMDLFYKALDEDNLKDMLEAGTLEVIGNGACGTVYKINSKYALKLNNRYMSRSTNCRDGQTLERLQGLPMIPTLYAYTEDNYATLIQLIDGDNVGDLWRGKVARKFRELNLEFDAEANFESVVEFYNGAIERGLVPNDLHNENVMFDTQGKLWIVDVGLFKDVADSRYVEGPNMMFMHVESVAQTFGKSVDRAPYIEKCVEVEKKKVDSLDFPNFFTTADSLTYSTSDHLATGCTPNSEPYGTPMDTGDLISILGGFESAPRVAKPVKFGSFEKKLIKQYTSKRVRAMLIKTLPEGSF